jgi:hypothetical protein
MLSEQQPKIKTTVLIAKKAVSQIYALWGKQGIVLPRFNVQYIDVLAIACGAVLTVALIRLLIRHLSRKRISANGYVLRKSKSGQYQLEHREIAKEVLKRRLRKWDVVHHINGRKTDNRLENLCVLNNRDHDRYHEWYDWIFRNYGNYPRRETQLQKLREDFNGLLLIDFVAKRRTKDPYEPRRRTDSSSQIARSIAIK